MDEETGVALNRLLSLALDDTGGSRVAVNFLLAWWNAPKWGGFDLTEMWLLDEVAARDLLLVFAYVSANAVQLNAFVERAEIALMTARWRTPKPD